MFICKYIGGCWKEPQIIPYQSVSFEPSTSVFHYGQAVFEGMKAYKDNQNKIWLFRPLENFNRINRSSERLEIPKFPEDFFFNAVSEL